jgi:hypothetical protein
MKLEFSRNIFEKFSNKNLMKIHPVTADLFHVDGQTYGGSTGRQTDSQTDMTKLTIAVRNLANAPKN